MTYIPFFLVFGVLFLKEFLIFNYELIIIIAFLILILIGKKLLHNNNNVLEPQLAELLREPHLRVSLITSDTRKLCEYMLACILVPTAVVDLFNNRTEFVEVVKFLEKDSDKIAKTELLENTLPQGLTEVLTLELLEKQYNTIKRSKYL